MATQPVSRKQMRQIEASVNHEIAGPVTPLAIHAKELDGNGLPERFLESLDAVVTLREGHTPLLPAPPAAAYGGLDALTFKHQGFNPTGSFKDNGMTCGVAQALRLGMARVACVSTGNTSASMAAYASAAGLDPIVFIPHGNISY